MIRKLKRTTFILNGNLLLYYRCFNVTFDQLNASLLSKSVHFFFLFFFLVLHSTVT